MDISKFICEPTLHEHFLSQIQLAETKPVCLSCESIIKRKISLVKRYDPLCRNFQIKTMDTTPPSDCAYCYYLHCIERNSKCGCISMAALDPMYILNDLKGKPVHLQCNKSIDLICGITRTINPNFGVYPPNPILEEAKPEIKQEPQEEDETQVSFRESEESHLSQISSSESD